MFDFLRSTKHFRWLAYVIEWLAPVIVMLALMLALALTFQRSADLQQEARKAQLTACNAVKQSNDSTITFLTARVTSADGKAFVRDLSASYAAADKTCRVKP